MSAWTAVAYPAEVGQSAMGRGRIGPVRVAWADASIVDAPAVSELARLGASHVRRHEALEGVRAARFAVGRRLMAQLAAELVPGADVTFSNVCPRCGADHGPPIAAGLPVSVSVSYAGSMVVAAAVHDRDAGGLGIDVEAERPGAEGPMVDLAALFAPAPPPDLRAWTLIEAALKADGRGLSVPPADVVLRASGEGAPPASLLGDSAIVAEVPDRSDVIAAAPAPGPRGFVVSIAVVLRRTG